MNDETLPGRTSAHQESARRCRLWPLTRAVPLSPSTLVAEEFVMASLTIGEVSRLTGVRPSALRYYEAVGVLPAAARRHGQRRYDDAILARLAVVRLAQAVGFSVAEMQALVEGFDETGVDAERWQKLARGKL